MRTLEVSDTSGTGSETVLLSSFGDGGGGSGGSKFIKLRDTGGD